MLTFFLPYLNLCLLIAGHSLGRMPEIYLTHAPVPLHLEVQPMFKGKKVNLDVPLIAGPKDSLVLHSLRFYLSNLVLLKKGQVVLTDQTNCHLVDLEIPNTLALEIPVDPSLQFDQIRFQLGIDSLTNVAGAMGGDLDPTKGMFWTWQSGYINAKLEGFYNNCPSRNHLFQFHLGGYLGPFKSVQTIVLAASQAGKLDLQLDLEPFFDQVNWAGKNSIMSPSKEAVSLSVTLAKSFSLHAH